MEEGDFLLPWLLHITMYELCECACCAPFRDPEPGSCSMLVPWHGIRAFTNYHLRLLLYCDVRWLTDHHTAELRGVCDVGGGASHAGLREGQRGATPLVSLTCRIG